MSTCNRLDLQTLGSQLIVLKNLPNHWYGWLQKGLMPRSHQLSVNFWMSNSWRCHRSWMPSCSYQRLGLLNILWRCTSTCLVALPPQRLKQLWSSKVGPRGHTTSFGWWVPCVQPASKCEHHSAGYDNLQRHHMGKMMMVHHEKSLWKTNSPTKMHFQFSVIKAWSHQHFRPIPIVKVLGIMLRSKCWPTIFLNIITRDAIKWC